MTWNEFSSVLWEGMKGDAGSHTHGWAVACYRDLQRWNEKIRAERDEARRLAEEWREYAIAAKEDGSESGYRYKDDGPCRDMPDCVFPWEEAEWSKQ